jgi:uncharacterized protein (TIGR03083 family)
LRVAEVLDHAWFCEAVEGEIAALAAVLARASDGDMSSDVLTCPGWTVAELAGHTGVIHRWATTIVVSRAASRPPHPEAEPVRPSADGLAEWLAAGAVPLLAALRAAGPVTPVWTWGPGRTSGWWARRIVHETAMHRADAELALGVADPVIDPVLAADGIDEFLFNLPSARRAYPHLASLPTGASLHLHATDADGEWLIRFTESGIAWERGHLKATVAVRGPVASLLLFTYGRLPCTDERLAVFGDSSLLDTWQQKTAL